MKAGTVHRTARCAAIVLVTALCAGCFVTIGDFDATPVFRLDPGATTRPAVDSLFGAPRETTVSGSTILYRYMYSDQDPQPSTPRIDRKLLLIEFVRDTLNGFLYSNSVGAVTTDFPDTARDSIVARRSHAADVRRFLGEPSGRTRVPSILFERREDTVPRDTVPEGSREAWIYAYAYTQRVSGLIGYTDMTKNFAVFFDSAGTVTGSSYHGTDLGTPFCCSSEIRYRLEETSCVTIEVYDLTGFLIAVPTLDEEETEGYYTRTFPLEGLPPGVYLVRIRHNDRAEIKRMMLMR